jgi:hypothetical protein
MDVKLVGKWNSSPHTCCHIPTIEIGSSVDMGAEIVRNGGFGE